MEIGWGQNALNQEIPLSLVKFEMPVRYVKEAVGQMHLEFRAEVGMERNKSGSLQHVHDAVESSTMFHVFCWKHPDFLLGKYSFFQARNLDVALDVAINQSAKPLSGQVESRNLRAG